MSQKQKPLVSLLPAVIRTPFDESPFNAITLTFSFRLKDVAYYHVADLDYSYPDKANPSTPSKPVIANPGHPNPCIPLIANQDMGSLLSKSLQNRHFQVPHRIHEKRFHGRRLFHRTAIRRCRREPEDVPLMSFNMDAAATPDISNREAQCEACASNPADGREQRTESSWLVSSSGSLVSRSFSEELQFYIDELQEQEGVYGSRVSKVTFCEEPEVLFKKCAAKKQYTPTPHPKKFQRLKPINSMGDLHGNKLQFFSNM